MQVVDCLVVLLVCTHPGFTEALVAYLGLKRDQSEATAFSKDSLFRSVVIIGHRNIITSGLIRGVGALTALCNSFGLMQNRPMISA